MSISDTFPKEAGLPRKLIHNIQEYLSFINEHNGKKQSIFESVYKCEVISGRPSYDNVIIDKIFLDFDTEDAWQEANKLHQYLKTENVKHRINFSGRGYHIYIFTTPYKAENIKSCIYNAQKFFADRLDLKCDTQVFGDVSRLCRVPNTYNGKRLKFCIPLNKEEFIRGDEFCKDLATKQHFIKDWIIGEILLDLKKFDFKTNEELPVFIENLEESSSENIVIKDLPKCIEALLIKKNLNYRERYLVILYFKEKGYTKKEVLEILKKHLSEKKFRHCILEERQLQYLWERDDLMFPNIEDCKVYKS